MLAPGQFPRLFVLGRSLLCQLLFALGERLLALRQLRLALGVRGLPLFQLDGTLLKAVSLIGICRLVV